MTIHLRGSLDRLPAYAPGRTLPGAVKLASNEMAFPPLPEVTAAIEQALAKGSAGINRYPDNAASELTAALAAHVGAERENITVGCGSVALCLQLIQATCDPGDEVLFGWRSFEAYPIISPVAGAAPIMVPLSATHALDLPAMAAAITQQTRLIFLCTPNNPTGRVATEDEIETFLDAVPDTVLVAIDEAYREFVTDPRSPDGTQYALARPNVVSLRTLSKAYGLAGLRVGYAVSQPEIIQALQKVALPFAVNYLAQAAALASLTAREEIAARCAQVVSERGRVTQALRQSGYEVPTSEANFIWLPLRERAAEFAAHCEAWRVIVRPFSDSTGGVRVTIGAPDENDQFLAAAQSWGR
jgi:histidinol-phosphate aminotransferase